MKKINIAIDGPSGVGKSSVAKEIAKRLDLVFINTGLMYRAIGYYCVNHDIDLENEQKIIESLKAIDLNLLPNEKIELNGVDITNKLWSDQISLIASKVAKLPKVREFCVHKQQLIAKNNPGIVMEGRDIGSVVLKDAELKIFLEANNEIRTKRRVEQLLAKGINANEADVLKNIIERDKRDSERDATPLIKVPEAIAIDTSYLTLEEVIQNIVELAKEII